MGLFDWFKKNKKNSISSFNEIDRENQKHRELERQKRVIKRSGPIMSKDKQSEILAKIKEVADKNGIPYEIELDKAFTDESKSGIDKSHDSELRIDWDETEDIGDVTYYKGSPFTGLRFKLNGMEEEVVNGLKHGLLKWNYESGQLYTEQYYKEGIICSMKHYHKNGKLKSEVRYLDGKKEGLYKSYHESGKLSTESNYKKGKEDGVSLSYYENGQIADEFIYKNGEQVNPQRSYYENGQLCHEGYYTKSGDLISGRDWDESGNEINPVLPTNTDIKTEHTASLNTTFDRLKKASESWEDFLLELLDDNGCQIEIFLCDSLFENYEEGTEFSAIEMQIKRFYQDETGEWMEDDETYFPELICAQDKDENYKNYIVYNTPAGTPQLGSGWTNYDRMTIPEAAKLLSSFKFLNYDNLCEEGKTNFKYFSSSKLK